MKYYIFLCCMLCFGLKQTFAQSKKNAKENNIRSSVTLDIEHGKTLKNKTTFFNKKGEPVEESDYDKNGELKTLTKFKYAKNGDVLEEETYDVKTKTTEKKIYKYNALGEKTEEHLLSKTGITLKIHYYKYDLRGLKIERKTVDAAGKIIAIRKYTYTYNK